MIPWIDIGIAAAYIVFILAVGLWSGISHRRLQDGNNASSYFLAGKSLRWPAIGLALFATNISTVHLVSLAQSGFDTGLLNGNFEWMAAFTLVLLALFFVPFYIRSGVSTLPDFLERRYDRAARDWLAVVSVASAIIVHIAFSMLAGGIVLQTLFGLNLYASIVVIAAVTAVYTIIGGLKAVVVTESIQTIVLLVGAIVISVAAYERMGGWGEMIAVLDNLNEGDKLSMLRPHGDIDGMPWYAVFLGYPIIGIWYWCADQTIVQRVLGARDENHARVGALFCGFLKILPVFIFVLPGLLAFTLANTGALDLTSITRFEDGEARIDSKGIYTLMITQLLPSGLVGVLVAALISGLMSQVSGALNSISTLVSYDFFGRRKPSATDRELVFVGRITALAALLFSFALLPLLNRYESIFVGLNDVIAHIAPPITCVFVLGICWKKASSKAANYTLWIGSLAGVVAFSIGKLYPDSIVGQIPFMMMAFYLFCFCMALQVTVSLLSPMRHTEESETLVWKSLREPLSFTGWPGIANYKFLSCAMLAIMAVLYWIFS